MGKKKTTVYEDREARRLKYLEKHALPCPHCGGQVLDHMTECPHCKQPLTPRGYTPLSDKRIKRIKLILFCVGMAVAIAVIVLLRVLK